MRREMAANGTHAMSWVGSSQQLWRHAWYSDIFVANIGVHPKEIAIPSAIEPIVQMGRILSKTTPTQKTPQLWLMTTAAQHFDTETGQ